METKQQASKASNLIDRQSAIDVLHGYFDGMLETDTWSPCDVYGLIEILPSADVPDINVGDMVSRQVAIESIQDAHHKTEVMSMFDNGKLSGLANAANIIRNLPSAEPELCEDAVSRKRLLSDLKKLIAAWKKYPVMAEQIKGIETAIGYVKVIPSVKPDSKELSSTHKALDTISRQAAIVQLSHNNTGDDDCDVVIQNDIETIKALPSSEPEIIMCKDCRHNGSFDTDCPISWPKDDEDYCSYAER